MRYGFGFTAGLIVFIAWQQRRQILQAWLYRRIFRPIVYWGVASLYVFSGATISFVAFGALHLGINYANPIMQIGAAIGLISMGLVHVFARKFATPVFDLHAIPQRDRNQVHSLWMMFWVLGLAIGFLPVLLPIG